jgi:hypothetical protein
MTNTGSAKSSLLWQAKKFVVSLHPAVIGQGPEALTFQLSNKALTKFTNLQELCLSGLHKVATLFPMLSRIIYFASLLRLNVFGCNGANGFFSIPVKHVRHETVALQDLALSITDADDGVSNFLTSCHALATLHINNWNALCSQDLLRVIVHVAPHLRTLTLHEAQLEFLHSPDEGNHLQSPYEGDHLQTFELLLQPSRNLHFLGRQISCHELECLEEGNMDGLKSFLVSSSPSLSYYQSRLQS